jgi:hypothetical protein
LKFKVWVADVKFASFKALMSKNNEESIIEIKEVDD